MEGLLHAPLPVFIAQAATIIVLARLVGLGARRLGQPMVLAETLAGILLGPSLLGWAAPRVSAALFPPESMPLLATASQLGLVVFMFLIGLELDPKLLRGRAKSSLAMSAASTALPFGLGVVLALRARASLMAPGVSATVFALFVGAAMSVTAFPVLARILVERRLLRSRVGAIAIACAAIDDLAAWCILAVVASVARAPRAGAAVTTVACALAYVAVMLLVVRPLLARLAARPRIGLSQDLVALALVGVLASSWVTELIGIHALFGAFLFGAIFPKAGTLAASLAEKVEDFVVVLLLPLFFAHSGLRTQIGLLDTPNAWLTCGAILVVACVGKFGGSFLGGRLTGLDWREAGAVGALLNTRGLMELVVLNIGLDLGVITPALFTMMVVTALVTAALTTPLLDVFYPLERLARELAETPPSQPRADGHEPHTTVLCVTEEETGRALVAVAAAITGPAGDASRLYALRLLCPADRASIVLGQQRREEDAEDGDALLDPVVRHARALDVNVRPLSFVSSAPARDICDVADVKRADLLVLGIRAPAASLPVLTGVVRDVMVSATCDVALLVDRGLDTIRRALVPYAGTEHDRAALRLARRLATHSGARITVLYVTSHDATDDAVRAALGDDGAATQLELKVTTHATASEAVIEESRAGYDVVLVGIGRRWGLEHASVGRRAEAVLARAAASVVLVRGGAQRPSSATERAPSETSPVPTVA